MSLIQWGGVKSAKAGLGSTDLLLYPPSAHTCWSEQMKKIFGVATLRGRIGDAGMTAARAAPGGWSADLCEADSGRRRSGARPAAADGFNLDRVRQLFLHLGGVGHDEDLAESGSETGERAE